MTAISMHPTPRWATIWREQAGTMAIRVRDEVGIFLGLVVVIFAIAIATLLRHPGTYRLHDFGFGSSGVAPLALAGFALAFIVWWNEGPSRRDYHWSMPVARGRHTLVRLAVAWVYLMVAVAVYVALVVVLAAVVEKLVGVAAALSLAHWAGQPQAAAPLPSWAWWIPFTSATVAYLLGSAIVVGSGRPIHWVIGIVAAWSLLLVILNFFGLRAFYLLQPTNGYNGYSLAMAVWGNVTAPRFELTGRTVTYIRHAPDVFLWLSSTLVWAGVGLGGTAIGAYRGRR